MLDDCRGKKINCKSSIQIFRMNIFFGIQPPWHYGDWSATQWFLVDQYNKISMIVPHIIHFWLKFGWEVVNFCSLFIVIDNFETFISNKLNVFSTITCSKNSPIKFFNFFWYHIFSWIGEILRRALLLNMAAMSSTGISTSKNSLGINKLLCECAPTLLLHRFLSWQDSAFEERLRVWTVG